MGSRRLLSREDEYNPWCDRPRLMKRVMYRAYTASVAHLSGLPCPPEHVLASGIKARDYAFIAPLHVRPLGHDFNLPAGSSCRGYPQQTRNICIYVCTMLVQRRRRWTNSVQMLYKCFVFAGY